MHPWYLAYSKSGSEFAVTESLRIDGIRAWCGKVQVEKVASKAKRIGPRVRTETVPALPNYLFINMTDDQFHKVTQNPPKGLYPTFTILTALAVREFEQFRDRVERMGVIKTLKPGAELIAIDGFLKGQAMRLQSICEDGDRIRSEIDMMGRKTPIEYRIEDVELVT